MGSYVTFDHREPGFHTFTKFIALGALVAVAGYLVMDAVDHWNAAADAHDKLDAFTGNKQNALSFTKDAYDDRVSDLTAPIAKEKLAVLLRSALIPPIAWTMWVIRPYKKTTGYQYDSGNISW